MASPATDAAFEALKTYDAGSRRGVLEPIDAAVLAALASPGARLELEQRLAAVLGTTASIPAKEYVCAKLRLIGGANSVSALSQLLADPRLSDAARSALQTMSDPRAARALREALPRLADTPLIGAIDSLGKQRDATSVSVLARLLAHSDTTVSSAAAAALGEIGTRKAARALRKWLPTCPAATRLALADACLVCAGHLRAEGHADEALEMCRGLLAADYPEPIRAAARRAMSPRVQSVYLRVVGGLRPLA
jgi:HEAT repeat protein